MDESSINMEEDSFAFYIFSGFVAASTVVTWAIVTYISRERTYESAKRRAQGEDLSWMETDSPHSNSPVKTNVRTKTKSVKQSKVVKNKAAEFKQSSTTVAAAKSMPSEGFDSHVVPVNEDAVEAELQIESYTDNGAIMMELLSQEKNKPVKSLKKKKDKNPNSGDSTSKGNVVDTQGSSRLVSKETKQPLRTEERSIDDDLDDDEWQAVPVKSSKLTLTSSKTAPPKNSSKKEAKSLPDKKMETKKLKDSGRSSASSQATAADKSISEHLPSSKSTEDAVVTTSDNVSASAPAHGMNKQMSSNAGSKPANNSCSSLPSTSAMSKFNVNNNSMSGVTPLHVQPNQYSITGVGGAVISSGLNATGSAVGVIPHHHHHPSTFMQGSPALSESLEHSDSTEELIESRSNLLSSRGEQHLPSSSVAAATAASQKPKHVKVSSSATTATASNNSSFPQTSSALSHTSAGRTKRLSERSVNSVSSDAAKNKGGGKGDTDSVTHAEIQKLEDELKHERIHNQGLRDQFLRITEQVDRDKQTMVSLSQQLQQKIQECNQLKSSLSTQSNSTPVVAHFNNSTQEEIVKMADYNKNVAKLEALQKENQLLQKELNESKRSALELKSYNVMKLQTAEAQLKQIESRNNELQDQCNKYEMQIKSVAAANAYNNSPCSPHKQQKVSQHTSMNSSINLDSFDRSSQCDNNTQEQVMDAERENRLLAQLSDLEENMKCLNNENSLLKQQHEATYAEMSRLTESKIALQKQNNSLKDEIEQLKQILPQQQHQNGIGDDDSMKHDQHIDISAASNHDWSQANCDLKKLSQLELAYSELNEHYQQLKVKHEELIKTHSINKPKQSANQNSNNLHDVNKNGVENGSLHSPLESFDYENGGDATEVSSKAAAAAAAQAATISIMSNVQSTLKDTIKRLYPEVNIDNVTKQAADNSHSPSNEYTVLVSLLEQQTVSKIQSLVERESSLSSEVDSLKNEVSKACSDKNDLTRKNERYQVALNETEASVVKLDHALSTLEAEYKEKLREITEENNLLRHDTDRAVELQVELDQANVELAKLRQQQGELQVNVDKLTTEMKDKTSQNESLIEKFQSLQSGNDVSVEQISKLEKDLQNAESNLEALRVKHRNEVEQILKETEDKIKCLESNLAEKTNVVNELEVKFNEASQTVQSLNEANNKLSEENEKQLKDLSQNEEDLRRQLSEKNRELSELRDNFEKQIEVKQTELSQKAEDLKRQLDDMNSEMSKVTNDLERKLSEKSEEFAQSSANLEKQIEEKRSEMNLMREEFEKQISEKDFQLLEIRSEISAKVNELSCAKEDFEKQLSEKNEELSQLKSQLENEISQKSSDIEAFKEKEISLNATIEKLSEEKKEVDRKLEASSSTLDDKNKEMESLRAKINELEQEKTQLAEQSNSTNSQISQEVETLKVEMESKNKTIDDLKNEINNMKQCVEEKEESHRKLIEEKQCLEKSLKEKSDEHAQSLQTNQQDREASEKRANELQQKLSEIEQTYQKEKQHLADEITDLKGQTSELEKKLQETVHSLEESNKKLTVAQESLKAAEAAAEAATRVADAAAAASGSQPLSPSTPPKNEDKGDVQSIASSSSGKEHKEKSKTKDES